MLEAYDHPDGRIYALVGGLMIAPWYAANSYIQWSEEHQKYGLYKYDPMPSSGPKGGIIIPGSVLVAPRTHDRVGAEPSFERALDWLTGRREHA
jgi:hypothetical protein